MLWQAAASDHGFGCRPVTLASLLSIKKQHPAARLVVGNTEVGIEMKLKDAGYAVLVGTTHVPELNLIEVCTGTLAWICRSEWNNALMCNTHKADTIHEVAHSATCDGPSMLWPACLYNAAVWMHTGVRPVAGIIFVAGTTRRQAAVA